MNKRYKYKKAHSFVWLYVIVSIFGMGLLYIVFSQPFDNVSDYMSTNLTGSRYESTYTKLIGIWNFWPLIFLIGILIFGIVTTMRRDEYGSL